MNENNMNGATDSRAQRVPQRILAALLASVSAGVVPREGAPYIAIGRRDEIAAILQDLEHVDNGGGAMRFLIGRYGSGKSFLIQLVRGYALEKGFLTADADLSPERRLYGSGGGGTATYRELIKNLASKTSPDGGALPKIIAKWISNMQSELAASGLDADSAEFRRALNERIYSTMKEMELLVGGFDFARVINEYYSAILDSNEEKMSACLRWLRGEFSSKTEARAELGFNVSVIINDDNWYDFIKLWAALSRRIGYRGLVVFIDECVNLYKISHRASRESNYEKILSMFNDTLQGKAAGLGIIFGGTPQFLEDTRRGLYSYEALKSRLCDSRFSAEGFKNLIGPVIRLRRLSDEELYALICRITALHEQYYKWSARLSDDDKLDFLNVCLAKAGANSMITPREMLRDYMTILNILLQNPEVDFSTVVRPVLSASEMNTDQSADTHYGTGSPQTAKSPVKYTLDDLSF